MIKGSSNYRYKFAIVLCLVLLMLIPVYVSAGGRREAEPEKEARPFEGVTLNVISNFNPAVEETLAFLPEFEQETGMKVNVDQYRWEDMMSKQEMELASGDDFYDVMFNGPFTSVKYREAGWAENLEDFAAKPELRAYDFELANFFQGALNLNRAPDGTIVGIPYSTEVGLLYYRTDLLEKAGLDRPPRTWEELEEYAKILHNPDEGVYGFVTRGRAGAGMNMSVWAAFLWSYGGRWFDDNGYPVLDSPEAIEGTEMYINLLKNYGPPGVEGYGVEEAYTDFAQGHIALYYESSVWLAIFNDPERSRIVGDFAVVPIPTGPLGRGTYGDIPYGCPSAHAQMIPVTSKNKEAAWHFIQWFTSPEIQRRSAMTGRRGDVTIAALYEDPGFQRLYNQEGWADAFQESAAVALSNYRPVQLEEYFEVGDAVGLYLSRILTGDMTTEAAMREANREVTRIMRRYGTIR